MLAVVRKCFIMGLPFTLRPAVYASPHASSGRVLSAAGLLCQCLTQQGLARLAAAQDTHLEHQFSAGSRH